MWNKKDGETYSLSMEEYLEANRLSSTEIFGTAERNAGTLTDGILIERAGLLLRRPGFNGHQIYPSGGSDVSNLQGLSPVTAQEPSGIHQIRQPNGSRFLKPLLTSRYFNCYS